MIITWHGHSCFRLEAGGYSIVLDPYTGVPGLAPLRLEANEALASHQHDDHNHMEAVTLLPGGPSPFHVTRVPSSHDDAGGAARGANTIHVLAAEGIRAAHLGDLGTALEDAQIDAIGPLDALMIPVGGHYTIDAQTAKTIVDALSPTVVIPMHYRGDTFGFDVIAPLADFLALAEDIRHYDTNAITVTKETPRQTAVLSY